MGGRRIVPWTILWFLTITSYSYLWILDILTTFTTCPYCKNCNCIKTIIGYLFIYMIILNTYLVTKAIWGEDTFIMYKIRMREIAINVSMLIIITYKKIIRRNLVFCNQFLQLVLAYVLLVSSIGQKPIAKDKIFAYEWMLDIKSKLNGE
jgi:hypothetical protein